MMHAKGFTQVGGEEMFTQYNACYFFVIWDERDEMIYKRSTPPRKER